MRSFLTSARGRLLCMLAVLNLSVPLRSAPASGVEGEPLLDESGYASFGVSEDGEGRVRVTEVDVSGPGFNRALRIQTLAEGSTFPKVSAVLRHGGTLARGSVVFATFHIRTVESPRESGEGWTQFELEDNATFAVSGQFAAHASNEWRKIEVPLRLVRDCPEGRAAVNFRVGDQRQTIEIGGLRVIMPPPGTSFGSLPATPVLPSYQGSEPGAAWRAAARERIERHRRSDLDIVVVDAAGNPVPDAVVRVRQLSHAYRFGSAVRADLVVQNTQRADRYRADILRLFSAVTFENDLKWARWLADRRTPVEAAAWIKEHGLALRGHTMVWASQTRLPAVFQSRFNQPELLGPTIIEHITDIGRALSPKVVAWDVLNEPFRNRDFMNVLGDRAMIDWFAAAKAAAPEACLFVNDYGIISGGGMDERHQDSYEQNVRFLLENGAPLGGLGLQGHFGRILTPPERVLAILDRFGRFGLPLELTEYSTQISDPALSAAYLRDMLTVFFSHPQTTGFILWGFQEGHGFKHSAALLDKNSGLTPCGQVWNDLVLKEWWTDVTSRTGPSGTTTVRGFHGRHELQVSAAGVSAKETVILSPDSGAIRVQLPSASSLAATP